MVIIEGGGGVIYQFDSGKHEIGGFVVVIFRRYLYGEKKISVSIGPIFDSNKRKKFKFSYKSCCINIKAGSINDCITNIIE